MFSIPIVRMGLLGALFEKERVTQTAEHRRDAIHIAFAYSSDLADVESTMVRPINATAETPKPHWLGQFTHAIDGIFSVSWLLLCEDDDRGRSVDAGGEHHG